MKFFAFVLVIMLVAGLAACNSGTPSVNTTTTTYNYIYTPSEPSSFAEETLSTEAESETQTQLQETTVTQETTVPQETTAVSPETTTVAPETTTSAPESTVPAETTTEQESTTKEVPETTTASEASDITLNMSMPEANGTMEVDLSEDNKYIQIVVNKRGIDASLLVAVYSVPESGQNYVFEFSSEGAENRTVDNLRRVYLIDSSGKISFVAAASSSEAENVSVVENWFNMNVLIKGMIFPAIEDKLK